MESKDSKWFTGCVDYEGMPLHLRFPEAGDFDALSLKYPVLVTITHTLDKVTEKGEPTAEYNASLEDFDMAMIDAIRSAGHIVLIETFSGRRTYYGYVGSKESLEEQRVSIEARFPMHSLEWESQNNLNWSFIREYSNDFDFYE